MRSLDDFLPSYEFSERHRLAMDAPPERIDLAMRTVSPDGVLVARALWAMRRLGRLYGDDARPFVDGALENAVVLDDAAGEGIVGLTGGFWRLRGGDRSARARTAEKFLAYDRPDACKAVPDPASRRKFRRYRLVIRPFGGLIRILFLRATRRKAEAAA